MPASALPDLQLIEISLQDGIATLALNRPDKLNAMNDGLRAEFIEAMEWAAAETQVRALIVTGKGRAFCAGGDIAAMKQRLEAPQGQVAMNGWRRQQRVHGSITRLHDLPKPTIAAVNGPAAGLGADLALACDFVIAAETAMFTMSYVLRGLIPDGGGMYFLPRRVGLARAKELIFSGRRVEAKEALDLGMIERVVPADALMEEATAMAKSMCAGSANSVALIKSIMNKSFEMTLEQVFAQGSQAQAVCYTTDEHREAVAAFLAKGK